MAKSVLQAELRKKQPFDCPEQEATLNLLRSADFLTRDAADLLEEHAISTQQYNVLRILRGHRGAGVSCQEIVAQMVTQTPDITRLVDRLEAAGLASRARTTADRRVVLVHITKPGLALLKRLDKPILDLHRRQMQHMTPAEIAALNRLLVKLRRPAKVATP